MDISLDLKTYFDSFLNDLKRKKDNFNYKLRVKGNTLEIKILKYKDKDRYEYTYSSNLSLSLDDRLDLKNDLLDDILFD